MNAEKIFGKNVYVNLDEVIETVYQCRGDVANNEWVKRWFEPLTSLQTIEVSEDCISRKGLIDSFLAANKCKREEAKACLCFVDLMLELIEDAPSVTTEQSSEVGEWQITDAYPHNVYCSECHKKFAQTHWAVWEDGSLPRNYCPNCGAKMKG